MGAIDFKKDQLYKAKTRPEIVDVPEMPFVMVDGKGAPDANSQDANEFQTAMQVLFGIVYTIKFWDKKHDPPAGYEKFTVAPIEGLWWTTSGKEFDLNNPADWRWTVMIRLPEFVTPEFFRQVVDEVIAQKKSDIYKKARLERFAEGKSVQIMHIGPYDTEEADVQMMHEYALAQGYAPKEKHHELYFTDPRRTKPEKLRTIVRHPVVKT